jgi:hypothetical protein
VVRFVSSRGFVLGDDRVRRERSVEPLPARLVTNVDDSKLAKIAFKSPVRTVATRRAHP